MARKRKGVLFGPRAALRTLSFFREGSGCFPSGITVPSGTGKNITFGTLGAELLVHSPGAAFSSGPTLLGQARSEWITTSDSRVR
jgi:hypothetical protein